MAITTFPGPEDDRNEQLRRSTEQLKSLLKDLAVSFDVELTNQRAGLYLAALMQFPVSQVRAGILRGVQKWRFFPQIAELVEVVKSPDPDPDEIQQPCDRARNQPESAR